MRTDKPLLVSIGEAEFQLSLPNADVVELIRDGDLTAVKVRDHVLITYDSLVVFMRRAKREKFVPDVRQDSHP
jgi:hypothetical protein